MQNEFETWLKSSEPAGRHVGGKLVSLAAAGTATALVGLSVVLMAGLGLPAGELPVQATAPVIGQNVRHAAALPTVTVVGRREAPGNAALEPAPDVAALPARTASADAATVGMSATGDNLRQ